MSPTAKSPKRKMYTQRLKGSAPVKNDNSTLATFSIVVTRFGICVCVCVCSLCIYGAQRATCDQAHETKTRRRRLTTTMSPLAHTHTNYVMRPTGAQKTADGATAAGAVAAAAEKRASVCICGSVCVLCEPRDRQRKRARTRHCCSFCMCTYHILSLGTDFIARSATYKRMHTQPSTCHHAVRYTRRPGSLMGGEGCALICVAVWSPYNVH